MEINLLGLSIIRLDRSCRTHVLSRDRGPYSLLSAVSHSVPNSDLARAFRPSVESLVFLDLGGGTRSNMVVIFRVLVSVGFGLVYFLFLVGILFSLGGFRMSFGGFMTVLVGEIVVSWASAELGLSHLILLEGGAC